MNIDIFYYIYLPMLNLEKLELKKEKKSYEYITAIKSFFTKYKKLPFLKIKYFFAAFVSPELTRETGESKLIKQSPPSTSFFFIDNRRNEKERYCKVILALPEPLNLKSPPPLFFFKNLSI